MKRFPTLLVSGFIILLFTIAACVSEVEREGPTTPAASPTVRAPTFTLPPPSPTARPPTPTQTTAPTVAITVPPTLIPTSEPTPAPTATPPPTREPVSQLVLVVLAPRDGSTVRTDAVVVHGDTSAGAQVVVEGFAASVDPAGRFQVEVTLVPGINTLRVVATDSMGNQEIRELNVTSLALPPLPFLLLVTEPEDQSIVSEASVRLSGRTGPEAITSVNGVSVSVDELGFFSTVITLEPGPNIIDVVATDFDGRVLSTVLALIYRP